MTTTLGAADAPATPAPREVRRAYRDLREPVLGGVAAGLAEHLGISVLMARVGFVVAAVLGGSGIAAYAVLWAMLPAGPPTTAMAPGLESATRGGRRPGPVRRIFDVGPVIVLGALGIGAIFVLEGILGAGGWVWPLAIAIAGVGLLWRQADEAQRERWVDAGGRIDPVRIVLGNGGWASWARLAAGVALIVVAIVLFTLRGGSITLARDVTLAVVLVLGGLAIVIGPWVYRLAAELSDEREERVRTQERADVAAHLHDSVL
jgi:phage shock protein PspC (stress-responsive transcriptional regulator)